MATLGGAWQRLAWQGEGFIALISFQARLGVAWQRWAWHGWARAVCSHNKSFWQGTARHGEVRLGLAGLGKARAVTTKRRNYD